tara:strand:+ start:127 stop:1098 length:972 start_codon:yes stop_codon:yes gene_type:complete
MITTTKKIKYIESIFGNYSLSRSGTNIAVECPSCGKGSDKKKFSICLETLVCHCWVCGLKGKTPYYIIKKFISDSSSSYFLEKFNIKVNKSDTKEKVKEKPPVVLPKSFMMIASNLQSNDPDFKSAVSYLFSRGVTENQLWHHKIGLCISGGFWHRRIIFPSFDMAGNLTYYVSRSIDDNSKFKYLNAKADRRCIVFDEIRLDWKKELTIVEGVFDMIKSNTNTTCLLGNSLTETHALFNKIVVNNTPVLLALDPDAQLKTYKIAKLLSSYGVSVKILDVAGYKDVGSMPKEEFIKRRLQANRYSSTSRLYHLIDSIKSGSIF